MSALGPALRVLDAVLDAHTLVLSRFILDEVQRVLLYPRIQARYRITAEEIVRFTGNLAEVAHLVEPTIVSRSSSSIRTTIPSSTRQPTAGQTFSA